MRAVDQYRRNRRRRATVLKQRKRFPKWPFAILGVLLLAGIGAGVGLAGYSIQKYNVYTKSLTNPADKVQSDQGPAILFDRSGNELFEYEDKNTGLREPVPLDAVSPYLIRATIATEDPDFLTNNGVNQRGLIRAACENVQFCSSSSTLTTGGSGITQQLVKLLFETPEEAAKRSVDRKLKEAALAVELTKRYNKDQILEWYLNTIYYANRANGIGAAAKIYFGAKASGLDLAQASLLAGIPASPGDYDPVAHYSTAKERQAQVLKLMVQHGQATQAEAERALAETLNIHEQTTVIKEPHWVSFMTDYIRQHCKELVHDCKNPDDALYHMGLRFTTTLDSDLTDQATKITDEEIGKLEDPRAGNCGCHNGAAVVIDNNTGQILAMVGSRDYYRDDIQGKNNNVLAQYQPGSALKPLIYLSTFLKGWSPGTVIVDGQKCYPNPPDPKPFCPTGPTNAFNGPVPVRIALGSSLNSPAVQAADFSTIPWVLETAHKMGITTMPDPSQYGPSIATGGSSVTLFDMTYMYSTFANNGEMRGLKLADPKSGYRQVDPVAVLQVEDRVGNLIYQFHEPDRVQAEPAPYAYEITDIIKDDNAKHLIYSPHLFDLRDGRPIAAKTGTQQGETLQGVRATWNFGYIPDITVGAWVGNSDGQFVNPNLLSATSSLFVWKRIMQLAVDKYNIPKKDFVVPPGIVKGEPAIGARLVGCGIQPDIFVQGQTVSGPPLTPGAKDCRLTGTPGPSATVSTNTPRSGLTPRPGSTGLGAATPAPLENRDGPPTPQLPQPVQTFEPLPTAAPPADAPATPVLPQNGPPASQAPPPAAPQPTQAPLRCPPGFVAPTALRNQICGPG